MVLIDPMHVWFWLPPCTYVSFWLNPTHLQFWLPPCTYVSFWLTLTVLANPTHLQFWLPPCTYVSFWLTLCTYWSGLILCVCGSGQPRIHRVGQNHAFIGTYIRCTCGIVSKEITIHTVIYGADIRFWPTQRILMATQHT